MHMKASIKESLQYLTMAYGPLHESSFPRAFHEQSTRYLWTDAYGVLSLLSLYEETKDVHYRTLAETLVNDTHAELAHKRHLNEWLDGASEDHPTMAGLRIGKEEDEGRPDGDGQYFHYLTKWVYALLKLSEVSKKHPYLLWAQELALNARDAFVYFNQGEPSMVWKISMDQSKPLTSSQGNLDPFDGWVTLQLLRNKKDSPELQEAMVPFQMMVDRCIPFFNTSDPLDCGEALWLAHFFPSETWSQVMHDRCLLAVDQMLDQGLFEQSFDQRLAFREIGLGIGLTCDASLDRDKHDLGEMILQRCKHPDFMKRDQDITPVMLAAALCRHSLI